jgi:acyl-CoA thioester hydrolase
VEGFSFSKEVQVRFAETDAQGIAHHAAFVVYFEVARVAYLAAHAGGYQAVRDSGVEALTTEVFVRYHQAAYFDDQLIVWTRCTDLRGARFRYEYRIARNGELVADGHTRHATVDRASYRPTRVPEWLASAVAKAESEAA